MALELKYFVLKPRSKRKADIYAKASRMAMFVYASWIKNEDPELAKELTEWARLAQMEEIKMQEEVDGRETGRDKNNRQD